MKNATYRRIESLANLEENWDGHGGSPIDAKAIEAAVKFMETLPEEPEELSVTPEPDGRVGLDWNRRNSAVALSFDEHGRIHGVVYRRELVRREL